MESQVRRPRSVGRQAAKGAGGRERQAEEAVAEAMLDNAMLKDISQKMVTPAAKRQAVAHACGVHGVSERRAQHRGDWSSRTASASALATTSILPPISVTVARPRNSSLPPLPALTTIPHSTRGPTVDHLARVLSWRLSDAGPNVPHRRDRPAPVSIDPTRSRALDGSSRQTANNLDHGK